MKKLTVQLQSALWQNYDFLKLWLGQGVSMFGSLIGKLALPFLVIYTMAASPREVAYLRVCELVPGIVVGLFAGVWVDRLPRRAVMTTSDIFRALCTFSIPLLYFLHHISFLQIYIVAIVVSVFTVTFDSAYGAYLPTLVTDDEILDANGKLSATGSVAEVAGFGITGMLFDWIGGAMTLTFDAFSFLVSALSLMGIRKREAFASELVEPRVEESSVRQSVVQELREGISFLYRHPMLSRLCGIAGVQNMYYGLSGTVYILFISRVIHVSAGLQGVLYAVGGIASLVTSSYANRLFGTGQRRFGRVMSLAALCGTVGTALLPLAFGPVWLLILFILSQQLLGDGGDTVFEIGMASIRQLTTDNALLGRVNAIWQVVIGLCTLVGTLAGGELAMWIGIRGTLFVAVGIRVIVIVWSGRIGHGAKAVMA